MQGKTKDNLLQLTLPTKPVPKVWTLEVQVKYGSEYGKEDFHPLFSNCQERRRPLWVHSVHIREPEAGRWKPDAENPCLEKGEDFPDDQ